MFEDEFDEGAYFWNELQSVPSYIERFDPRQEAHMVIVSQCSDCGHWHNSDDEQCPVLVEV